MATWTDTHQGTSQIRCTTCKRSGWITYTATTTTSDDDHVFRQTTTVTHTPTGTVKTLARKGDLDRFRTTAARRTFDCGHPLKTVTVKGVINTEHACGPKCTNAVGPSCECSCGGDNHGADHGSWNPSERTPMSDPEQTPEPEDVPMTAEKARQLFESMGVDIVDNDQIRIVS